ncbi:hypothetical protein CQ018_17310 [Arthrobacter sp. MYb227]|nr:hypothetical protein CQ018_17310 [Arthrobacter sp. MYb227]
MSGAAVVANAEALHPQADYVHILAGRGAHYIFTLKVNQPTLLKPFATCSLAAGSNRASSQSHGLLPADRSSAASIVPG